MREIVELYPITGRITVASDIFKHIKTIHIDHQQENFILLCLNTKHQIIHSEILFKGGLNSCIIDIKTIFRVALKYNSCDIIIAHNHPSGELFPSQEDKNMYDNIKKAGEILTLLCIDSIIFNENEFYSMNRVV